MILLRTVDGIPPRVEAVATVLVAAFRNITAPLSGAAAIHVGGQTSGHEPDGCPPVTKPTTDPLTAVSDSDAGAIQAARGRSIVTLDQVPGLPLADAGRLEAAGPKFGRKKAQSKRKAVQDVRQHDLFSPAQEAHHPTTTERHGQPDSSRIVHDRPEPTLDAEASVTNHQVARPARCDAKLETFVDLLIGGVGQDGKALRNEPKAATDTTAGPVAATGSARETSIQTVAERGGAAIKGNVIESDPAYGFCDGRRDGKTKETGQPVTYFTDIGSGERAGSLPHGFKDLAEDKPELSPIRGGSGSAPQSQDGPARSSTSGTSETSMITVPKAIQLRPSGARVPTFNQIRTSFVESEKGGVTSAPVLALNSLMKAFGRSPSDRARELDPDEFELVLQFYMTSAHFYALSIPTRQTRPDVLRSCVVRFVELQARLPLVKPEPDPNPYWAAIDRALDLICLDRRDALRLSQYRMDGYMPKCEADAAFWERKLKLPKGALWNLCWHWEPEPLFELRNNAYVWSAAASGSTQLPYAVKELPPAVDRPLSHFCSWKRADSREMLHLEQLDGSTVSLARSGLWTMRGGDPAGAMTRSERMVRETLRTFFGFLILPTDHPNPKMRGLGIKLEDIRLTHFFIASNITAFCAFQETRNGRFDHTGLARLVQDYTSLVGAEKSFGRFAQALLRDDLQHVVGCELMPKTPAEWDAWCSSQKEIVADWVTIATKNRKGKNKFKQARPARDKIAHLLSHEQPIEEVVWPTIVHVAEHRPPVYYKASTRYEFEVKLFTLVALTVEPLRDCNWRDMIWGRHLGRRNGRWEIEVPAEELKNRRLLSEPYRSVIDEDAAPFFDAFYARWTEHFGFDPLSKEHRHKGARVMAAADKTGIERPNDRTIADRLEFLDTLWGFTVAAHVFRHIWATDWLKRHPEDFHTVAGKLDESEKTIRETYGNLKSTDHAQRANRANAGRAARAGERLREHQMRHRGDGCSEAA